MKLDKILKILAVPAALGLIVYLENRRPLRDSVESKTIRTGRNTVMAGTASVAMMLAEKPAVEFFTKLVERENFGLLKILKLPKTLDTIAAVLLLDYTLYLWHVLTHKVPFLWRFHLVHHVDLDLDSTTAYRFHFGEILISVLWRTTQILVIGASPHAVKIWQMLLFPAVLFHHSNLNLPAEIEEKLSRVLVTPHLHGIHHSAVEKETNSNWSSGLSIWDQLHKTFKSDVNQQQITIGVPTYQNPQDVELKRLLVMPFERQRSSWQLETGEVR